MINPVRWSVLNYLFGMQVCFFHLTKEFRPFLGIFALRINLKRTFSNIAGIAQNSSNPLNFNLLKIILFFNTILLVDLINVFS